MKTLIMIAMLLVSCANPIPSVTSETSYPLTPDVRLTPGDMCSRTNPDFDEERYLERIPHCKRNVTLETKKAVYASYGLGYNPDKAYTIDHLWPLSMGGSNSPKNLWPQHRSIYSGHAEYYTFCRLRDGAIVQADALHLMKALKFDGLDPDTITRPPNCDEY